MLFHSVDIARGAASGEKYEVRVLIWQRHVRVSGAGGRKAEEVRAAP